MATRSSVKSNRRTVTTPTYTKQSFREFKKLNVPPKAGRSLTSFKRRGRS